MNQVVEIGKVFDVYPNVIVIIAKDPKGNEYRLPAHLDQGIDFNDIRGLVHINGIVGLKGYLVFEYGEMTFYTTKISILK